MRFRRDGRHITAAIRGWFGSLKKSAQIVLIVCLAHFVAIVWMSLDHFIAFEKKHRPLFVRTIQPTLPVTHSVATKQQPPVSSVKSTPPITPRQTTQHAAAKNGKKISASKKTAKKITPPPRPAQSQKKIEPKAIEQTETNFANTSTPKKASTSDIHLPAFIESKSKILTAIEESPTATAVESTYHLCLIETLQNSLQLPEIGDVTVKIALQSPGTIQAIEIIETQSKKNADWLKNQLPLLELPCFQDFGIVDAFLEFTIKFRNAENS